jgi:hypothetical protein
VIQINLKDIQEEGNIRQNFWQTICSVSISWCCLGKVTNATLIRLKWEKNDLKEAKSRFRRREVGCDKRWMNAFEMRLRKAMCDAKPGAPRRQNGMTKKGSQCMCITDSS